MGDMSEKKVKILAYIGMMAIVITWAFELIIGKIALQYLSPIQIISCRMFVAVIVLSVILVAGKEFVKIAKKDWLMLGLASVIGNFIYFLCEYYALDYLNASLVSIILALLPLASLAIEIIIYKKWPGLKVNICVLISIIGVVFVIGAEDLSFSGSVLGFALAFGAVLCWAVSIYSAMSLLQTYSATVVTFYRHVITAVLFLPLMLMNPPAKEDFVLPVVLCILALGTICSAVLYIVYAKVLKVIGPIPLSVCSNIFPALTVIASFVLLNERLGLIQLIGCGLILISVLMISNYKAEGKGGKDGKDGKDEIEEIKEIAETED